MKKKGFTLIELMIVITIIGLLVAIMLPRVGVMINRSREKATMANLNALKSAIFTYRSDWGRWPGTDTATAVTDSPQLIGKLVPRYINNIPAAKLRSNLNPTNWKIDCGSLTIGSNGTPTVRNLAQGGVNGGWVYSPQTGNLRINCSEMDTYKKAYWGWGYE